MRAGQGAGAGMRGRRSSQAFLGGQLPSWLASSPQGVALLLARSRLLPPLLLCTSRRLPSAAQAQDRRLGGGQEGQHPRPAGLPAHRDVGGQRVEPAQHGRHGGGGQGEGEPEGTVQQRRWQRGQQRRPRGTCRGRRLAPALRAGDAHAAMFGGAPPTLGPTHARTLSAGEACVHEGQPGGAP